MSNEYITLQIGESGKKRVRRTDYIRAKTRDLCAFGYKNLTESEVSDQLDRILAGQTLSVIGMFMKDDIVKPDQEKP